jgi:hypothetical protein
MFLVACGILSLQVGVDIAIVCGKFILLNKLGAAEAVGFLGAKKSSARLPSEGK